MSPSRACARPDRGPRVGGSVCGGHDARGLGVVERRGPLVISEEELMDARALARQGYTYAEIGRLLGRDWRTVKRYLETGEQRMMGQLIELPAMRADGSEFGD